MLAHAVHLCQEGRYDPLLDFAACTVLPPGTEGVHLVDDDDARALRPGLAEEVAQLRLGLAVVCRRETGPRDGECGGVGGGGDGAREVRLACAWWAVEEDPTGGFESCTGGREGVRACVACLERREDEVKRFTKVVEEVWTGEWDLDEVPDF